jgi:D-sedoheptulose 7-phosphate isomerase
MQKDLLNSIDACIQAVGQLKNLTSLAFIEGVTQALCNCFQTGNKVLIAGNGGSLCDALHFAEELTGFFRQPRKALPAIALADPGHISCVSNDIGYESVFSRGVEAYGKENDLFIGLTTSGNSPNIIRAFETASRLGLRTVALLGKEGGKLKGFAEFELIIEGFTTSDRIQEAHMAALHLIIEFVEKKLFTPSDRLLRKMESVDTSATVVATLT